VEWVEISAKTVEEAKDRALDSLGVDERDAEFEILEEPRAGIFGRVKGEARVRARVKPAVPRAKVERRARRDRPERAERPASRSGGNGSTGRGPKKETAVADDSSEPIPAAGESAERAVSAAPSASRGRSSRDDERSANNDLEDLDLAQQTDIVAEVVRGVIGALGDSASVSTRQIDDDTTEVAISGEQLGFLVGPRGRTLTALNEVSRSIVLRRGNTAPSARVHIDVSGYRQRRRDALTAFCADTAEKVRETGLPHAFEPMGSVDRKVIHDAVGELDGVTSISEGEDSDRRVVIVPA
jgi:spoIIIJ-associated protein